MEQARPSSPQLLPPLRQSHTPCRQCRATGHQWAVGRQTWPALLNERVARALAGLDESRPAGNGPGCPPRRSPAPDETPDEATITHAVPEHERTHAAAARYVGLTVGIPWSGWTGYNTGDGYSYGRISGIYRVRDGRHAGHTEFTVTFHCGGAKTSTWRRRSGAVGRRRPWRVASPDAMT